MTQDLYEGKTDHDLLIMIHTTLVNTNNEIAKLQTTLYAKPNGICAEVADLKGKYKTIAVIGGVVLILLTPAIGLGMWIFDKLFH